MRRLQKKFDRKRLRHAVIDNEIQMLTDWPPESQTGATVADLMRLENAAAITSDDIDVAYNGSSGAEDLEKQAFVDSDSDEDESSKQLFDATDGLQSNGNMRYMHRQTSNLPACDTAPMLATAASAQHDHPIEMVGVIKKQSTDMTVL